MKNGACERLRPESFGDYRDSFFIDYVIRTKLKGRNLNSLFINNRNLLNKLKVVSCNNQIIEIKDKLESGELVYMKIEKQKNDLQNLKSIELLNIPGTIDTFVYLINGYEVYGIDRIKDTVELIKSIDVVIGDIHFTVPDDAFRDLFFPNFCETLYSIKPIEAFFHQFGKDEYIYLYIFGKNDQNLENFELRRVQTFMAKLIFNKNGYVGRILATWGELNAYQWGCPNFIGF
ncbi:MAG: hypothetical protein HUU45_15245 [Leptospiraceae bacterium]|nr:hypothetical protein [Leptospiraceae bacterium]